MDADDAADGTAAASKEVRLPAFNTIDPAAWFLRAEIQFRLKKVASAETKADHVLASLGDDAFAQLAPWLRTRGAHVEYEGLKVELMHRFSPSAEVRAERLLQLINQPLGDDRPSLALEAMRALATLPDGEQIDVVAVMWLSRLPATVRAQICRFTSLTSAALSEKADGLVDAARAAAPSTINQACSLPAGAGPSVEPPPQAAAVPATKKQRPKKAQMSDAPADSTVCFYHWNFGRHATKCRSPCSFPKNE